jgi:hypothetical protein
MKIADNGTKLVVSLATYGEIAMLLEAKGMKPSEGRPLIIEQGTVIAPPVDFRLATMRRDAIVEASKLTSNSLKISTSEFINIANDIYSYILNSQIPKETKPDQWS